MASGVAAVWVPVDEMERAVAFYRDALGLSVRSTGPDWSEIDADGLMIGLNAREGVSQHAEGGAVVSFTPDGDIEAEVERLRSQGVRFTGDISDHDWGRIVPFKDSEGNDLQLYAPPA